jgi:hypothetical protein
MIKKMLATKTASFIEVSQIFQSLIGRVVSKLGFAILHCGLYKYKNTFQIDNITFRPLQVARCTACTFRPFPSLDDYLLVFLVVPVVYDPVGAAAQVPAGTRFTNFTKFLLNNLANFLLSPPSGILPLANPLTLQDIPNRSLVVPQRSGISC